LPITVDYLINYYIALAADRRGWHYRRSWRVGSCCRRSECHQHVRYYMCDRTACWYTWARNAALGNAAAVDWETFSHVSPPTRRAKK